jgi:hypothetical protein
VVDIENFKLMPDDYEIIPNFIFSLKNCLNDIYKKKGAIVLRTAKENHLKADVFVVTWKPVGDSEYYVYAGVQGWNKKPTN